MELWLVCELLFYLVLALAVTALYKLHKPTKMWIKSHLIMLAIISGMYLLVRLAIWGLMSLESFYRNITLASLPLQLLMVSLNAIIFVYMYMIFMRGGFAKLSSKLQIRGEFVNIKWSDVVGMENIKEEAMGVLLQLRYKKNEAKDMVEKAIRRNPKASSCEEILNEVYKGAKV